MNLAEGARRIAVLQKCLLLAGLCVFFILFSLCVTGLSQHHWDGLPNIFILPLMLCIPGAGLCLASWVVQGFAAPTN